MPYWSVYCVICTGFIIDALLECVPAQNRGDSSFKRLFKCQPGAALACPYCGTLLGFNDEGDIQSAQAGWPVFRYGLAELEAKKIADGEAAATTITDWALRSRFMQPGTHPPFTDYMYAEQAPANEVVP